MFLIAAQWMLNFALNMVIQGKINVVFIPSQYNVKGTHVKLFQPEQGWSLLMSDMGGALKVEIC